MTRSSVATMMAPGTPSDWASVARPPRFSHASCCDLKRDDRNNSIIAIDDNHVVADHEVAVAAPLRMKLHEGRRDRNDAHRPRHCRAHADGEVDVARTWHVTAGQHRLSDLGALLCRQRAARLSLLSLALLRGLTLRTLAWLCTLALLTLLTLRRLLLLRALLGLARALGLSLVLRAVFALPSLIALALRALGLSLVLRAVFALPSLIALTLLLARLHLIFLTLLRLTLRVLAWLSLATLRGLSILSRRAAGRTLALGGRA